jgi:hypothetical protein
VSNLHVTRQRPGFYRATQNNPDLLRAGFNISGCEGADLMQIVERSGMGEPDIAEFTRVGKERALASCRELLKSWHKRGVLRKGLTEEDAAGILWTITKYGTLFAAGAWAQMEYGAMPGMAIGTGRERVAAWSGPMRSNVPRSRGVWWGTLNREAIMA